MPLTTPEPPGTSVLLIDANETERASYAEGLKRCSSEYRILEATSGQSGLDLYRESSRIDCVILDLALPRESGLVLIMDLIPIARRPNVAVIVLTNLVDRGLWDLAKTIGAHACLYKQHTSFDDLDKAIQRAIAFVGLMPKENRSKLL